MFYICVYISKDDKVPGKKRNPSLSPVKASVYNTKPLFVKGMQIIYKAHNSYLHKGEEDEEVGGGTRESPPTPATLAPNSTALQPLILATPENR